MNDVIYHLHACLQIDIYIPATANADKKKLLAKMGANLKSYGNDAAVTEVRLAQP
jgi:hypothetical protein